MNESDIKIENENKCKPECNCQQCYSQKYYLNNKAKILKYQKEYYYENSNPRKRRMPKEKFKFKEKINNKEFIITLK